MRHHDKSENGPAISKMAAEHRRVAAPLPAFPMLRGRQGQGYYADPGSVGQATVTDRPVGGDVREGEMLAISRGYGTERGTVSQGQASVSLRSLAARDGAIGPATSRGGHPVVDCDGTNGLLTVGPTSGVGGNCSGVSLEMRGATTAGPLCGAEPESGNGRGLVDVGARAITLDSVDRRGAAATEAPDLRPLTI